MVVRTGGKGQEHAGDATVGDVLAGKKLKHGGIFAHAYGPGQNLDGEMQVAEAPGDARGLLQIGAYKSEAEANAAWTSYQHKHDSLLGGLSSDVKQVDLGAKGTWYRLRIAAGSRAAAGTLCDKLKAEGGACIPSK